MNNYNDYRKNKKIGNSKNSDIKCSSANQTKKVIFATIYPSINDIVLYWNPFLKMYCTGKIKKYKSPTTLILEDSKEFIFTLKKNGEWTEKKEFGDNIFDIKFTKYLKTV